MLKKILIIALFVLFSGQLSAEDARQLKVQRADVDSGRETFITATKKFGINIIAENTMNCNSVAFELIYNQSDYIKFSGYEIRDFKEVHLHHDSYSSTEDRLIVGTFSGDKEWEKGIDEPIAVYLEFVVTPAAPDYVVSDLLAEFRFNSGADIITDTGIVTIKYPVKQVNYKIHGYVDVHPGDADNNGIVDYRDFLEVGRHNGTGALTKNFRSFKRETPSAQWYAQPALRWDSAMVTYSDCDGNGDITMADGLIVTANVKKTHSGGLNFALPATTAEESFTAKSIAEEGDTRIPIKVSSDKEFIGFCGTASIDDYSKIKGIEAGDFFDSNPIIITKNSKDGQSIDFLIAFNQHRTGEKEGVAAYLVLDGKASNHPEMKLSGLTAVSDNGSMFPIHQMQYLAIEEDADKFINIIGGELKIESMEFGSNLIIFDYSGQKVISRKVNGSANINLNNLTNGVYFVTLQKKKSIIRKKIMLMK